MHELDCEAGMYERCVNGCISMICIRIWIKSLVLLVLGGCCYLCLVDLVHCDEGDRDHEQSGCYHKRWHLTYILYDQQIIPSSQLTRHTKYQLSYYFLPYPCSLELCLIHLNRNALKVVFDKSTPARQVELHRWLSVLSTSAKVYVV